MKYRLSVILLFLCGLSTYAQRYLNVALFARSYNLDPYTANYNSECQLLTGLYEGLYVYDPESMKPQLALARSVDKSRDKKTWVFKLRDAAFSNGDPITAVSVRDSWLRLLSTPQAPFASFLDMVEGASDFRLGKGNRDSVKIIAKDDYTLQVQLVRPMEYFDKILCHHALSVKSAKKEVYSGAFVLKSQNNKEIIFEKNDKYWDKSNVKLTGINFLLSDDLKENSHGFNNGDIDWLPGNFDSSVVLNGDNIKIAAQFGTNYYFFKIQKDSVWANKDFRNALLQAVPWERLREGQFIPANTLVFPLDGYPVLEGLHKTDMFRAKQMLSMAKKDAKLKEDAPLTVTIAVASNGGETMVKQVDSLVEAWQELGVKVNVQKTPEDRYLESIDSWDADIFLYSWIGDYADPVAFLELFRSNSSLNVTAWHNDKYDKLLLEADSKSNADERMRTLSQAEEILLNEAVILPVGHTININLIDTDIVGGWFINALDIHPLKNIYIKTKIVNIPNLVMQ